MDSDSGELNAGTAEEDGVAQGDDDLRPFTQTVQLRSALGEVPKKPPAVSNNVSNLLPLAAALALVIIGGLVTILVNDNGSGDQIAGATLLNEGAAVETDSMATVAVLRDGDLYRLRINFGDELRDRLIEEGQLSPGSDYLAVWLTDPGRQNVLPLGVVHGDAIVPVPAGFDLEDFSVVDVSVEPIDGDPGHSGRTVLRGVLEES